MVLESTRRVELKVLRSLFSKPPFFITRLLLTQLLVHIKRTTNDCSNIDLWRRGLDLYRPTPLHFNLSAPFVLSQSAKKSRFLTLMQTRHFGIFFTPFPVMFHFFPSFASWTFYILETSHIAALLLTFYLFLFFLAMSLFLSMFAYLAYFYSDISSYYLASSSTFIIKYVDSKKATHLNDGLRAE